MSNLYTIIHERFNSVERLYRLLFYLLCITLLVTSVIKFGGALNKTRIGMGEIKIRLDHLLHALAYFVFSLYYVAGRYLGLKLFERHTHRLFFVILFVLGFLAEVMQIWVPYRSFNPMDMVSNLVGIGAGCVITVFSRKV